jgi:hypothetical protein
MAAGPNEVEPGEEETGRRVLKDGPEAVRNSTPAATQEQEEARR